MRRDDLTIIYYTSNRENLVFEGNIKRHLLETIDGLPLISVSQKPIDFGKNICVGDVGVSGHNAFRQFQIGIQEAKTKYICPAESDIVYPKEYFEFLPPKDDCFYVAMPLYVLFNQRKKARCFVKKSKGSESSMVVSRDCVLRRLEIMFKGHDLWGPIEDEIFLLRRQKFEFFYINPIITFKTDQNMHKRTPHDQNSATKEIPYWGNIYDVIKRFNEDRTGEGKSHTSSS